MEYLLISDTCDIQAYPPYLLDVLSIHNEESRTNNASESYNSKWNNLVQVKNPNFWQLGEKIFTAFNNVQRDMARLDKNIVPTRPKKRKNILNAKKLCIAEEKQDLDDEVSDRNSTETDSDNSEDEHNDTQLAVDAHLYHDESDTEILLQPTQPTPTPLDMF